MKEYMLIFRNEKRVDTPAPSVEQMQMVVGQWQTWIRSIDALGKYSDTNRLLPEGKTVFPNNIITDGPYVEGKEMIGGYVIVKSDSIDDAVEIAKTCPNLTYGGNVEVRSVMSIDRQPNSEEFLWELN